MKALLLAIVIAFLVAPMALVTSPPTRTMVAPVTFVGSAVTGAYFDYLVIVVMENHDLCQILTSCGGSADYMTSLANTWGLASGNQFCGVHPSLPNYLCLTGASDFGCVGYDGDPNSNGCTGAAWGSTNIVDRLASAGLTWKAYMEDMPSPCFGSNSGNYAVRHDPFVYYSNIVNDSARCARVVPAGTSGQALLDDLASTTTASNYMWFTPNNCNNMHSCSVHTGDTYLSGLVPKILDSNVFKTEKAALIITFDENSGSAEPIYTVWAGPVAKPSFTSSYAYDHFSLLATIEANWQLDPLTAKDRDAPNMAEFIVGQPSRGESTPPTGEPFRITLALVVGIAVPVAAVVIVAVFLLRRRAGQRGSPSKPRLPADPAEGDDEIWEL